MSRLNRLAAQRVARALEHYGFTGVGQMTSGTGATSVSFYGMKVDGKEVRVELHVFAETV